MIDIVFGDSACGSLKMAQHYGDGDYASHGGAIGVIGSHAEGTAFSPEELESLQHEVEERERLAWEAAVPMGGNPADVFGFSLSLSVGDISEDIPGAKRQEVLAWLYSIYPDDMGQEVAQDLLEPMEKTLATIAGRIKTGEALRLWYSASPDELCGLYWFVDWLNRQDLLQGALFLVRLPLWAGNPDGTVAYLTDWGGVAPGAWAQYAALQTSAPAGFRQECTRYWQRMQEENAPLRTVVNGQLLSVPDTWYDGFITREIDRMEPVFQEATVIGQVLGRYRLGIGDTWVAHRIEGMIRAGKLLPVTTPVKDAPLYHRMLKKCT